MPARLRHDERCYAQRRRRHFDLPVRNGNRRQLRMRLRVRRSYRYAARRVEAATLNRERTLYCIVVDRHAHQPLARRIDVRREICVRRRRRSRIHPVIPRTNEA